MKRWILIAASLLVFALAGGLGLRSLLRIETVEAPPLSGDLLEERFEHDGIPRRVQLYRPASLQPGAALVVVLHGSMGDAEQARGGFAYEWDRLADRDGFLVAYPEGFDRHWNGCRKAGPYRANLEDVDDVGFLDALAARAAEAHRIDRRRTYATGISNGGQMALRLALEAPRRWRAVAPVIASLPAEDNMGCRTEGRPVSILVMNGSEDPMNPWAGGRVALYGWLGDRGNVLSSEETIRYWAELAGHAGEPTIEPLPDRDPDDGSTLERRHWRAPGKPHVQLLAMLGAGHTVPHPALRMPRIIGRTNRDAVGAELIWRFFREAP
jgi:polyhydroxybutyrate depolymerase